MGSEKRVLVVAQDMESATELAGEYYDIRLISEVTPPELAGLPLLFWPTAETWPEFDLLATQLLGACDEIKRIMVASGPSAMTAAEMVEKGWKWADFYAWAKPLVDETLCSKNGAEQQEAIAQWSPASVHGINQRPAAAAPPESESPAMGSSVSPAADPENARAPLPAPDAMPADSDLTVPQDDATADYMQAEAHLNGHDQAQDAVHPRFWQKPDKDAWPVPTNFWHGGGLQDIEPELIPLIFRDFAVNQSKILGTDPIMVPSFMLGAAAGLICSGISLQMGESANLGEFSARVWTERAILWVAVVAPPSAKKGPAMDTALFRLMQIASEWREASEQRTKQYKKDIKEYEAQMSAWYKDKQKNPSLPEPQEPEKVDSRRLWTDNYTPESLALLLNDSIAHGKLTIVKDELVNFFAFDEFKKAGGSQRGDALASYESRERYVDRVGGSIHVKRFGVCVVGCIQPTVLARLSEKLAADSDGLLARFQLMCAKPARNPERIPPDLDAVRQWVTICDNLSQMIPGTEPVQLSEGAREILEECEHWITEIQNSDTSPNLQFVAGKYSGALGRIALVLHCCKSALAQRVQPDPILSAETMLEAWQWLRHVSWPNAEYFYGSVLDSTGMGSVQALAEYILARDLHTVSATKLSETWTHYKRQMDTIAKRRELFAAMTNAGWLRAKEGRTSRDGTMPIIYEVNPLIYDGRFEKYREIAKRKMAHYKRVAPPEFEDRQRKREPGEDVEEMRVH